jgi:prepilin peptidase CpaA
MDWHGLLFVNWHVKVVCALLIVAAYIDGKQLRVPNWLTFPMVFSGLIYSAWAGGWAGLGDGLVGMLVGLATLLPLYAVGGMGAGDVKLMAGIGAWLGAAVTWNAFVVSVIVGA